MKKEVESQLHAIMKTAPGFLRVAVLKFESDEIATGRVDFCFDKIDVDHEEKKSELTLEEALVRWFELEEVNDLYDTSEYGIPEILTDEDINIEIAAEAVVNETLEAGIKTVKSQATEVIVDFETEPVIGCTKVATELPVVQIDASELTNGEVLVPEFKGGVPFRTVLPAFFVMESF